MKHSYRIAAGVVASLGLGIAVFAHAHQDAKGEGMGHGSMMQGMSGGMGQGGMGHGGMGHGGMGHGGMSHGGMGHGAMGHGGKGQGGMGHGAMGGGGVGHGGMGHGGMGGGMGQGATEGQSALQQLMTPEEHSAFRERMRNATTREERQKLAEANRTELQNRAKAKGITLPEGRGPRAGAGPNTETHKH